MRLSSKLGVALAGTLVCAFQINALADALPSGERAVGNTTIEPAYDDSTGGIVYLHTPNGLAPLGSHPFGGNQRAAAPLYIVVYPTTTVGNVTLTLNCMGVAGNCPDHDLAIAGIATGLESGTYGNDPALVPGHDHLVGVAATGGDFNVPWHVYVELFTSRAAVTHITTRAQLQAAWASGAILTTPSGQGVDTQITFICGVVSQSAYLAGKPVS
jgi:hypothetical protein